MNLTLSNVTDQLGSVGLDAICIGPDAEGGIAEEGGETRGAQTSVWGGLFCPRCHHVDAMCGQKLARLGVVEVGQNQLDPEPQHLVPQGPERLRRRCVQPRHVSAPPPTPSTMLFETRVMGAMRTGPFCRLRRNCSRVNHWEIERRSALRVLYCSCPLAVVAWRSLHIKLWDIRQEEIVSARMYVCLSVCEENGTHTSVQPHVQERVRGMRLRLTR